MMRLISILCFCALNYCLKSQTIDYNSSPYCNINNGGVLEISLDLSGTNFSFPLTGYIEGADNDFYQELIFTSDFLIVEDLDIGIYNVSINLDEENIYESIECAFIDPTFEVFGDVLNPCNNDGSIVLVTQGGSAPFTYQWNNGSTTKDIFNLSAGEYSVTVIDNNSCQNVQKFVLDAPIDEISPWLFQPCLPELNNGGIILNLDEGLSVLWDTGNTESSLFNLSPGLYCASIFDEEGCSIQQCFELTFAYGLEILEENVINTCPSTNTGEIHFDLNYYSGYNIINWSDLSWLEGGNTSHRTELASGVYEVTITNNCETISQTFEVGIDCECESFTDIGGLVFKPCPNTTNGSIILSSINEDFDFVWSNGSSKKNQTNLAVGEYTVTVSDNVSGCSFDEQFILTEYEQLKLVNAAIDKSCPDYPSGSVGIDLIGGQGINSIKWEDEDFNNLWYPGNRIFRSNMEAGTYSLKVSNNCEEKEFVIEIPEFDIEFTADVSIQDCAGGIEEFTTSINTFISGDNEPFTLIWSNGSTEQSQLSVPLDFYNVTVTDAKGCSKEFEVNAHIIQEINESPSCEGLNDGTYSIELNNPTNGTISVTYAGFLDQPFTYFYEENANNTVEVLFEDLFGNTEYSFRIEVDGCSFYHTFSVEELEWDLEYSSHEFDEDREVFVCTYNAICNGEVLDDNFRETAGINIVSGDCSYFLGIWPRCGGHVEYTCNEEVVETRKDKTTIMRVGEYVEWLRELGNYSEADIELMTSGYDLCDRLRVCPADPECRLKTSGEFGGYWSGNPVIDENGCFVVECEGFPLLQLITAPDYTICDVSFLPDYIANYYNPPTYPSSKCDTGNEIVTMKIAQAIYMIPQLIAEFEEDFTSSVLYSFLNGLHSGESSDFFSYDERTFCSYISFCLTDFSIVTHSLEEADCEPYGDDVINSPIPSELLFPCSYKVFEQDGQSYLTTSCKTEQGFAHIQSFSLLLSTILDGFKGPGGTKKYITRFNESYEFDKYLYTTYCNGDIIPKICLTDGKNSFVRHFTASENDMVEMDAIEEKIMFYNRFPEQNSEVIIAKDSNLKGRDEATYYWIVDEEVEVSKTFTLGEEFSFYPLFDKTKPEMGCKALNYILKNKHSNKIDFEYLDYNLNKLSGIQIPASKEIITKNKSVLLWRENDDVMSAVITKNIIQKKKLDITFSEDQQILDYFSATNLKDEDNHYFIVQGGGKVSKDISSIQLVGDVNIVKLNQNGLTVQDEWIINGDYEYVDSEINENEFIFGLNFNGSVKNNSGSYFSRGQSDILVSEYSFSKEESSIKQYGNKGSERLESLFLNNVIYLNGKLNSTEEEIIPIGTFDYVNLVPSKDHTFFTYMEKSDQQFVSIEYKSNDFVNVRNDENHMRVYPNPVHNLLDIVNYNCDRNSSYRISNLQGQEMLNGSFQNRTKASLINLESGAYVVEIVDDCGNRDRIKIIKHGFN